MCKKTVLQDECYKMNIRKNFIDNSKIYFIKFLPDKIKKEFGNLDNFILFYTNSQNKELELLTFYLYKKSPFTISFKVLSHVPVLDILIELDKLNPHLRLLKYDFGLQDNDFIHNQTTYTMTYETKNKSTSKEVILPF